MHGSLMDMGIEMIYTLIYTINMRIQWLVQRYTEIQLNCFILMLYILGAITVTVSITNLTRDQRVQMSIHPARFTTYLCVSHLTCRYFHELTQWSPYLAISNCSCSSPNVSLSFVCYIASLTIPIIPWSRNLPIDMDSGSVTNRVPIKHGDFQ